MEATNKGFGTWLDRYMFETDCFELHDAVVLVVIATSRIISSSHRGCSPNRRRSAIDMQ